MLSKEQLAIVNQTEGPVLAIACPGAGKTVCIINRTKKIIENGTNPENILVITFTKEAANEMEKRFNDAFGMSGVFFGTIHAFCFKVLQKTLGYNKDNILRATDQWDFFRRFLYKKVKTNDFEEYIKNMIAAISYCRNCEIKPRKYDPENVDKEIFESAYYAYEEYKKDAQLVDFDDMLILTRTALETDEMVLNYWQDKYTHVMVDEYQDTSSIQASIIRLLVGKHQNICVVGDDDQSIYRFRGANVNTILDFAKEYPNCRTFYLSTNYRSGTSIIAGAGKLIKNNKVRFDKQFLAARPETGMLRLVSSPSKMEEADRIINTIRERHNSGLPYEEMAVLYRTNCENWNLTSKLIKNKIPFYVTETPSDFHNDFIFGDIMAYFRLSRGIQKKGDLQRILNRPTRYLKAEDFKDAVCTKESLMSCCRKAGARSMKCMDECTDLLYYLQTLKTIDNPIQFINYLRKIVGYDMFMKSFAEFCQRDEATINELMNTLIAEAKMCETMEEWQIYANEYGMKLQEMKKSKHKKGVCLSTYHSSKGLEWSMVMMMNANEGYAPFKKAKTEEDLEEERRLFYVGMTRAKDICMINYVTGEKDMPSEYLREIMV